MYSRKMLLKCLQVTDLWNNHISIVQTKKPSTNVFNETEKIL